MGTRLIDVHTVMPYNEDMDRGDDSEAYNDLLPKRYGSPYSNRNPQNTLDAMLDFYLAHPTSAPVITKEGAADNIAYTAEMFQNNYIPSELNHEDPVGDVNQKSHPDNSWARDHSE
jgi:hypothetical protein